MPVHRETRTLPYPAAAVYDLVADIGRYPEFLPWCAAARVNSRRAAGEGAEIVEAELVISFRVFRERFASRVTLWPERRRIETESIDGPFRHMRSTWEFRDAPGGCEVSFFVEFEFRNAILQGIVGIVFSEAMQRVVRAFEARAAARLGAAPRAI